MESFPAARQSESQDQAPEKVESGKKIFNFLDKTGFLKIRNSDEEFSEWIKSISYEDFKNYLTRINGILRESSIKQRSIDGGKVIVTSGIDGNETSYLPPEVKEKENMLREAFDVIQNISNNEDRALLIYYALQAIHPYSDGNGRTGRLLYELISTDGKEISEERLSELLNHDQKGHAGTGVGRELFTKEVLEPSKAYYYINREVAKDIFGEDFFNEYGSIHYSGIIGVGNVPNQVAISDEERKLAKKIIGEADVKCFPFRGLTILKLLQENGKLSDCQFAIDRTTLENEVVPEDVGKKILGIDDEIFEENLTAEEIKRLIELHKDIKARFIKKMLDVFKNPDKHTIKTKEGEDVQIKSMFHHSSSS